MDEREIRLRCVEAAAKAQAWEPANGKEDGVIVTARAWFNWIISGAGPVGQANKIPGRETLTLKK